MDNQNRMDTTLVIRLSTEHKCARESLRQLSQDVASWLFHAEDADLNEKTVHDIRVAIRQLKSLMYFYKPLLRKNPYRKAQEILSQALHTFEETRETDVLIKALEEFEASGNDATHREKERFKDSLAQWKNLLSSNGKDQDTCGNPENLSWVPLLDGWILLIRQDPFKGKYAVKKTKKFSRKRMRILMKEWLSCYRAMDLENDSAVHKSRIDCKKIRYMLRAMDQSRGKDIAEILDLLADYQDQAGEIHDIHRFKDMMHQPVSLDMALFRKAFFTYENERADALRKDLTETKKLLGKEMKKWIQRNTKKKP